jgi:hypothetical protein
MRVNSQARIAKRRKGALQRRQVNLAALEKQYANTPDGPLAKALSVKLGIAKSDIDNLGKKGVRA